MQRTLITWADDAGGEGAIEIDAVKTRGFESSAEVTEFPVERGAAITDHVRPLNGTLSLEGVISNTPMIIPTTQMQGITAAPGSVALPGGDGKARATMLGAKVSGSVSKKTDYVVAGDRSAVHPRRYGTKAAEMAISHEFGRMAAIHGTEMTSVSLADVDGVKRVPPEYVALANRFAV